jgi:hypothetical protein
MASQLHAVAGAISPLLLRLLLVLLLLLLLLLLCLQAVLCSWSRGRRPPASA